MKNDQLIRIRDQANESAEHRVRLLAEIAEEERQRGSWCAMLDLVRQTRGGSRAWEMMSPIWERQIEERRVGDHYYGYSAADDAPGFHWRGGLHFWRDRDGNVVIKDARRVMLDDGDVVWTHIDVAKIAPDEWASIVASVSVLGETSERWEQMRQFHNQAAPPTAPEEKPE